MADLKNESCIICICTSHIELMFILNINFTSSLNNSSTLHKFARVFQDLHFKKSNSSTWSVLSTLYEPFVDVQKSILRSSSSWRPHTTSWRRRKHFPCLSEMFGVHFKIWEAQTSWETDVLYIYKPVPKCHMKSSLRLVPYFSAMVNLDWTSCWKSKIWQHESTQTPASPLESASSSCCSSHFEFPNCFPSLENENTLSNRLPCVVRPRGSPLVRHDIISSMPLTNPLASWHNVEYFKTISNLFFKAAKSYRMALFGLFRFPANIWDDF